jgi:hypothetical protein
MQLRAKMPERKQSQQNGPGKIGSHAPHRCESLHFTVTVWANCDPKFEFRVRPKLAEEGFREGLGISGNLPVENMLKLSGLLGEFHCRTRHLVAF